MRKLVTLIKLPFLYRYWCIFLFCTVSNITLAQKDEIAQSIEQKFDTVFAELGDSNSPGMAVAIVQQDSIILKKGYGIANLEYNIPITSSTVFNAASVAKQFTAFSVLLLARQGKLSLEDDIRKYIPELNDFGKTIILKHLATHTSGLKDFEYLLRMAGWRQDDLIDQEDAMRIVCKQKYLDFDPGEQFQYSNTNYLLLAEVVARVSGQSFAQFTQENIFDPLNMESSFFRDNHEKPVKNLARSYYLDQGEYIEAVTINDVVGSTNLYTTAEDLAIWTLNFDKPKVGDLTVIKLMNTPAKLNNGEVLSYGMGQYITPYQGLYQIQHSGSHRAYTSYVARFPDQRFAVILLSNYDAINPISTSLTAADIYLKKYFVKSDSEEISKASNPSPSQHQKDSVAYSLNELNNFTGLFYSQELGTSYIIEIKDGKIIANHIRYPVIEFTPVETDKFTSDKHYLREIVFIRDDNHKITGLHASNNRVDNIWFEKVE